MKNNYDTLSYLQFKRSSVEDLVDFFIRHRDHQKNKYNFTIYIEPPLRLGGEEIFDEEETKKLVMLYNELQKNSIDLRFSISRNNKQTFSVEEAVNACRMIDGWVDEIKNAKFEGEELSPYEKYLYAYDIVTQFKYKKEGKFQSGDTSRNLISVLNGDRIVCAGFASLLKVLCSKLGIPCVYVTVNQDHAMCFVKLEDETYNIHGIYASDPTYDCIRKIKRKKFKQQGFTTATVKWDKFIKLFKFSNGNYAANQERMYNQLLSQFDAESENKEITFKRNEQLLLNANDITNEAATFALCTMSAARGLDPRKFVLEERETSHLGTF